MILPLALLAGCLLALSGCAAPRAALAPRAETLLSDRPAPAGRRCLLSALPAALPPADALVDSAALHAALAPLAAGRDGEGHALLSVGFDANGWNAWRTVIEHSLPAALADSVQALVFAHRRQVEPGSPWGVRLRIDLREGPRLRVGRQELCGPRLLDAVGAVQLSPGRGLRDRFAVGVEADWVRVRVRVDERGAVAGVAPEYGGAGLRNEAALIHYVQSLGFEPATVDGIPVASWTRLRVPVR